MPLCFCISGGCYKAGGTDPISGRPKGRSINSRLFEKHGLEDKLAKVREAEEKTQAAIDAELEEITFRLSGSTLSDRVSGPINNPGGRLWSSDNSDEAFLPNHDIPNSLKLKFHPKHHDTRTSEGRPLPQYPLPRRSREGEVLSCLAALESEVEELADNVTRGLASLVPCSLSKSPAPFPLIDHFHSLNSLKDRLVDVTFEGRSCRPLKERISACLDSTEASLQLAKRQWEDDIAAARIKYSPTSGIPYDTARQYDTPFANADHAIQVIFFMLTASRLVLGVSRRGCNFLLAMVNYVVQLILMRETSDLPPHDRKLLADIPADSRSPDGKFHLKSRHTAYAVCPNANCHALYKPSFIDGSPSPIYPSVCSHKEFSNGPNCGTQLLKPHSANGVSIQIPIKHFVAFCLKDWLGGLLSRPGFEEMMDDAWEKCNASSVDKDIGDIFEGEVIRNFQGPDGKHFGMRGDEGRYLFSLCVDFFNPLGNRQAGKKKSVGLVSLVCLNLPIDLRYQPENMFLFGVIPGPNEPPLACLNHYLTPLVSVLEEFWSPGIGFSRTYKHFYGRVAQAALVCVVCDLLAARKTIGFASIKHTQMCAMCRCTRKSHGLGNIDVHTWQRRTKQEFVDAAGRHQNAANEKERKQIVDETGLRWSALLRLPYFDPSRFVVVDAMHNLFLGLIQEHYEILGIKLEGEEDNKVVVDISPIISVGLSTAEQKSVNRLIGILEQSMNSALATSDGYACYEKKLLGCHLASLQLACEKLGATLSLAYENQRVFKSHYVKALLAWRRKQMERPMGTGFKRGQIFTEDEVNSLRSDIENMITPSWLASLPANLGESSHGKLKADQWRTLGTKYLPVGLVRLWHQLSSDDPRSRQRKELLSLTLSLISAIAIACRRTTSPTDAALYLAHMKSYLKGLKNVIPDYQFRPNQHMALHLPDYLQWFGPVHGWWTFPFERLIGLLQRLPNNFKMGQLEETIATTFVESANLRGFLLKDECPCAIKNCRDFFNKLVHPNVRNTLLADMMSPFVNQTEMVQPSTELIDEEGATISSQSTHQTIYNSLGPSRTKNAKFLKHFTRFGHTFSPFSRHKGNGSVILYDRISGHQVPAQLEDIIHLSSDEVYFTVRKYLRQATSDPFTAYPALQTTIWQTALGSVTIVQSDDILGHFAGLPFQWNGANSIAVISLC